MFSPDGGEAPSGFFSYLSTFWGKSSCYRALFSSHRSLFSQEEEGSTGGLLLSEILLLTLLSASLLAVVSTGQEKRDPAGEFQALERRGSRH